MAIMSEPFQPNHVCREAALKAYAEAQQCMHRIIALASDPANAMNPEMKRKLTTDAQCALDSLKESLGMLL